MKEIAQGVTELVSIEAAQYGLSSGAPRFFVGLGEFEREKVDDRFHIPLLWLGGFVGRHFAEVELIKNSLPDLEIFDLGKIVSESVEAKISLLLFGAVAVVTMVFKKGPSHLKGIAEKPARSAE